MLELRIDDVANNNSCKSLFEQSLGKHENISDQ